MRRYDDKFKRGVLEYVHKHKELTVYECSKVFGMGYSTLNKWLRAERNAKLADEGRQRALTYGNGQDEVARLQQELQEAKKTLKVLKDAFELLGR